MNRYLEFVVLELVGGSGEQDNCETKCEILYHTTYVLIYFVAAKYLVNSETEWMFF